jgi:hypothetical protein
MGNLRMNISSGVSANTAQSTPLQVQQNLVKANVDQDVKAANTQLTEVDQQAKNATRGAILDIIV